MKKVIMYSSNFSRYGKLQAVKSTLAHLSREAGFIFAFVNDPERGNTAKIKFGKKQVFVRDFNPAQLNKYLAEMQDIHAV
ncbi:hypothetical protein [Vibrio phage VpJYP1]|nr:hypothetical protein [Vibrio phage VpJYP1]